MQLLRKLRGLTTLAFAASAVWVPLTLITLRLDAALRGQRFAWAPMLRSIPRLAAMGAACGLLFGIALAVLERRRTFGSLTLGRTVAYGAIASAAIPGAFLVAGVHVSAINAILAIALAGVVGATMSGGILVVARRAPALPEPRPLRQLDDASH